MAIKIKSFDLFDYLIAGFIILTLIFLGFYFLRRAKVITIILKVSSKNVLYLDRDPPAWFAEYFHRGLTTKDILGGSVVTVEKVFSYDSLENEKAVYLTLDLKANYSRGSNIYSYEGQSLIIGAPLKIEFPEILAEGIITNIQGINDPRIEKTITVETQIMEYNNVFPETTGITDFKVNAVKVGDIITDVNENLIVSVLQKKSEPAQKIATDSFGNVLLRQDPLKKDLYLTLKLKVKEINGSYYLFDDVKVKIGNPIPLHFKNISFYPTVTKILNSD